MNDKQGPASLRDIKSERVKNLVRGLLAPESIGSFNRTMENLRSECSPADAPAVFRFLNESSLAAHISKPEAFPESLSEISVVPFYETSRLDIELAQTNIRLMPELPRIIDAIGQFGSINKAILAGDGQRTSELLDSFTRGFGLSLMVSLKALSLRHSRSAGLRALVEASISLTSFMSPKRQIVAAAFDDTADPDRDYLRVRRTFLQFVKERRLPRRDAIIISDMLSPLDRRSSNLAERLQAYGCWNLFDTVAALVRLRAVATFDNTGEAAQFDSVIPKQVFTAWEESFSPFEVSCLQDLVDNESQFFERSLYTHLPAWSEYDFLYNYRLRIERAVGSRLDDDALGSRRSASSIVSSIASQVPDLLEDHLGKVTLERIDPKISGAFHRTIALIAAVENGKVAQPSGRELNKLLDQTIDVARLLSLTELKDFLPGSSTDLLYEYLRNALIDDVASSKVSNHALRRALQKVVRVDYRGDIVAFLEAIDLSHGHVANHLFYMCNEGFLTELYELYSQSDEITEAQARILEWRARSRADADALTQAKSHRLSLRLRKVRDSIEVTRIYVDPLRFIHWIQDALGGELRAISGMATEILQDPDNTIDVRDPVKVALFPRVRLLKTLDGIYHEFCSNKVYGVASFIGRRIRHGTLHGYLILESRPEIDRIASEFEQTVPKFSEFLLDWLKKLEISVLLMVTDRVHIRSKDKPRGLIVASIDEADKSTTARRMLTEVATSMRDRPLLAQSFNVILEFCWLLFEADLKRLRGSFESLRREFTISVSQNRFTERPDLEQRIIERIRQLNSSVQYRFDGVKSWFTRPTNISPSASVALLCRAVLNEIKTRYPDFEPSIEISGADEVELIGHRFHYFYDAIYVLIDNAAKHGVRNGRLLIEVKSDFEQLTRCSLDLQISSELDARYIDKARSRIDAAMALDIGDAMVNEGNTGLRKLRGLAADVEEIVGVQHYYRDNEVCFQLAAEYSQT